MILWKKFSFLHAVPGFGRRVGQTGAKKSPGYRTGLL
jgi:hypothetical protein